MLPVGLSTRHADKCSRGSGRVDERVDVSENGFAVGNTDVVEEGYDSTSGGRCKRKLDCHPLRRRNKND